MENGNGMGFSLPANELARVLKIFAAKAGVKSQFPAIDLTVAPASPDGAMALSTDHKNGDAATLGLKAWRRLDGGARSGTTATKEAERLIAYAESPIFDPKTPLDFVEDEGRIRLAAGKRSVTVGSVAAGSVAPSTAKENPYGVGPGHFMIQTDPAGRPATGAKGSWEDWVAAGCAVVHVGMGELARVLAAGDLVYPKYQNTQIRFVLSGGSLRAVIQEPRRRDPHADVVDLDLEATIVPGSPDFEAPVPYQGADSVLGSLKYTSASTATLLFRVRKTDGTPERRLTIAFGEDDEQGRPTLRVSQTVALWKEGQKPNRQ